MTLRVQIAPVRQPGQRTRYRYEVLDSAGKLIGYGDKTRGTQKGAALAASWLRRGNAQSS